MKGLEKALEILTYDASAASRLSFIRGISSDLRDFLKLVSVSLASSATTDTYVKLTRYVSYSQKNESASKAIQSVSDLTQDYKTPRKLSPKADTILKLLVAPELISLSRAKLKREFVELGVDRISPSESCNYFGFNCKSLLVKTESSYKKCAHCRKNKVRLYNDLLCSECIKTIKEYVSLRNIPYKISIFNPSVEPGGIVENHLTFPYKFSVDNNYITINYVKHPMYQAGLPLYD